MWFSSSAGRELPDLGDGEQQRVTNAGGHNDQCDPGRGDRRPHFLILKVPSASLP